MPIDSHDHEFLTPNEVGELTRKPVASLAVDRCLRRDHPPFLKIGRKILYKKSDVLAWLESHRVPKAGGAMKTDLEEAQGRAGAQGGGR
jgi:hypothetical protein